MSLRSSAVRCATAAPKSKEFNIIITESLPPQVAAGGNFFLYTSGTMVGVTFPLCTAR